jgi:hypothetical protein
VEKGMSYVINTPIMTDILKETAAGWSLYSDELRLSS